MFAAQLLSWAMKTPIFIIILLMVATRAYAQGTHDTLDDPFLKLEDLDGAESEDWTITYEELSDLAENKIDINNARDGGYAVGAFNAENAEMVFAIIEAAQKCKAPVIIQTTPSTLRYLPPACFAGIVAAAAKNASVPVALHLDHGDSLELVKECLDAGYTSVMFDGSLWIAF